MQAFATTHSRALRGLTAPAVRVEVHLANGLPSFMIVGLPEAAVRESRERVRAAIQCCGFDFPNRRITVNLAPADLPKDSGRFDLPIAVGILAAAGHLHQAALDAHELLGELSLGGALRPIRAALALCVGLRRDESDRSLLLPMANRHEAALAGLGRVLAADDLSAVIAHLQGRQSLSPYDAPGLQAEIAGTGTATGTATGQAIGETPDLATVIGQAGARRALEIAAAGGHALLFSGPPGTGKSLLAGCLPALLPPLADDDALDAAAIRSSAGLPIDGLLRRPAFQAPHHSISTAGLIGGGQPPGPGQASLAQHGVLFLDELPEFRRGPLEALREPLETGRITLARGRYSETFPARFQLIAAMNPCPCGYLGDRQRSCLCSALQIRRYRSRLSGPLIERIDLAVDLQREPEAAAWVSADNHRRPESSAVVAARVAAARARQQVRQGECNARLPFAQLAATIAIEPAAEALAEQAACQLQWSMRARHRMLRVAATLADLAGQDRVATEHVAEAIGLRRPIDRFNGTAEALAA
jgi:magnesium chelatase family protein